MSKYFVVNGYQSDSDFWLSQDDFDELHQIMMECSGGDLMRADLAHMAVVDKIKQLGKQSLLPDNWYGKLYNKIAKNYKNKTGGYDIKKMHQNNKEALEAAAKIAGREEI